VVRSFGITPLKAEYQDASIKDKRRRDRLEAIVETMSAEPAKSFPALCSDAELEATYRFLNNDEVTLEGILAPHQRQTAARARACVDVVVAHDTTEFNFGTSSRSDLGCVGLGKSHGFYGHVALGVEADEHRTPLGVLAMHVHTREGGKGRRGHRALQTAPDNEFRRWSTVMTESCAQLGPEVQAVHVMDREADSYAFMDDLSDQGVRFVIRMAQSTRRVSGDESVGEAIARAKTVAERDVPISMRGRSSMPARRKAYPPRDARVARLEISGASVTLLRPASSNKSRSKTLNLNVVRVIETRPPEGEEPIEWRLWTTEPVDTEEQLLAVVDWYRCRWRIEEYFKALKTGCAFEQRQLESHDALVRTLAVFAAIAWRLMLLRIIAQRPQAGASAVFTPTLLKILRAALLKKKRPPLPPRPTARDAMMGVAALGGHIKANGEPGWQVLGRGMDRLLVIELGYRLALEEM
jgi:hypothetical protein